MKERDSNMRIWRLAKIKIAENGMYDEYLRNGREKNKSSTNFLPETEKRN